MPGTREMANDEGMALAIDLPDRAIDCQITDDHIGREGAVVAQESGNTVPECVFDCGCDGNDALAYCGEVSLQSLLVVSHYSQLTERAGA